MEQTTPNASECLLTLSLAHLILYSSQGSAYCKKAIYMLIYYINMRWINEFSWCEWASFGSNNDVYVLYSVYLMILIFLQSSALVLFWTWLLLKFLDSEYILVVYCAHLLKFRTTILVVYFFIYILFFSRGIILLVTAQICSKIKSWKCLIFLKIDVIIL